MHIVRVDFKNGLHLEFNYTDLPLAEQCRATLQQSRKDGTTASIYDEGGRHADIAGGELQVVQLVSLEEETVSIIRVGMIVDDIRKRLVPQSRVLPNFNVAPEPQSAGPALGRPAVFAS